MTTRTIYQILAILSGVILLSCVEKLPEMKTADKVSIQLTFADDLFTTTIPPVGKVTRLSNQKYQYTAVSNASGVVTFSGVVPGTYNVSVSSSLTEEEKLYMIDPPGPGIKVFANGVIGSLEVFSDVEASMVLNVGISSNLVISKVYFSGCKYELSGSSRNYVNDQYIEVYNNSDEDIQMKGYYLLLLETDSNIPFAEWKEDTVFAQSIFRFPERLLEPGKSIVIAREARDHRITAPTSLDLTSADLEPRLDSKAQGHTPNEDVPQMEIVWKTSLNYLILAPTSNKHLVLIKSENEVADDWEFKYVPGKQNTPVNLYKSVPVNSIVDAVDILPYKAEPELKKKRLPEKVDASYIMPDNATNNAQGSYISFDRKVISEVTLPDGSKRKVLKDTNNSLEDFVMLKNNFAIRDYDKPELYEEFEEEETEEEESAE